MIKKFQQIDPWHIKYLIYQAISVLPFAAGVNVVLWQSLNLSLGDIFYVKAIFTFVTLAFEVPCGYLADRWGYRKTLLLGQVFLFFGWLIYVTPMDINMIIYSEVLIGLGICCVSGTEPALLKGAIEQGRGEIPYFKVESLGQVLRLVVFSGAAIIGALIYQPGSTLVFCLAALGPLIGFIILIFFEDHGTSGVRQRLSLSHLEVLRQKTVAELILYRVWVLIAIQWILWLYQPLFQDIGLSEHTYGYIYSAIFLLGALLMGYGVMGMKQLSQTKMIALFVVAVLITYACLVMGGLVLIFLALLLHIVFKTLFRPLFNHYLLEQASAYRASVISVVALVERIVLVFAMWLISALSGLHKGDLDQIIMLQLMLWSSFGVMIWLGLRSGRKVWLR